MRARGSTASAAGLLKPRQAYTEDLRRRVGIRSTATRHSVRHLEPSLALIRCQPGAMETKIERRLSLDGGTMWKLSRRLD
jgi:hypothetical protein